MSVTNVNVTTQSKKASCSLSLINANAMRISTSDHEAGGTQIDGVITIRQAVAIREALHVMLRDIPIVGSNL